MLLLYDHKQVKVGNEALLALYDCRTAKSMVRVHFYGELKVQVCLFSSDIKGYTLVLPYLRMGREDLVFLIKHCAFPLSDGIVMGSFVSSFLSLCSNFFQNSDNRGQNYWHNCEFVYIS